MVKYLFFNVGTSGLPKQDDFSTARLVQLSWVLSEQKDFMKKQNIVTKIIKPDKFKISIGSSKIHKITNESAEKFGKDIKQVLRTFHNDLKDCSVMISHNIEFGYNVLEYEANKYGQNELLSILRNVKKMCLGVSTKNLLKLKKVYGEGYKMPKLTELYKFCFREDMKEYNVKYNLYAMIKIYSYLLNKYKLKDNTK